MNKIGDDLNAAYEEGYKSGRWTMFNLISSVYYGKECYFIQDDGTIYSRISSSYLANIARAVSEFLDYIGRGE